MEKRITSKVEDYIVDFKKDIKEYLNTNSNVEYNDKSQLLKFIYDYENITLDKTDFVKRKRVKSVVPHYLRCNAKRASGEQCTRKKKDDCCFCGTHSKNRPHGTIDTDSSNEETYNKQEVWLQEINGIIYYIDKFNNIYKTQDVLSNKVNPNIFAKYIVIDNNYSIAN
tara:strand:+ start:1455 stop:1958 length:504 start_codon:yes stop_codon:yes gene_type:complete